MDVQEGIRYEARRRRRIYNTSRSRNEVDDALLDIAIELYYLRSPVLDVPYFIHPALVKLGLMGNQEHAAFKGL